MNFLKHIWAGLVAFCKWIWNVFDGWKTRIAMLLGALLQLAAILDPAMISTAANFNQQQAAAMSLLLFVLGWLAREVAQKPGAIASALQKRGERG